MTKYRNTPKVKQPCRISVDQQNIITIVAPYNKSFIEEWQATINSDDYVWDEKYKKYRMKPSVLAEIVSIAQKYFPRLEGLEDIINSPYDTLQVAQDAPLEVCRAAHKALMVKYHPDRAPDATTRAQWTDMCQEFGEALKEIEEAHREETS